MKYWHALTLLASILILTGCGAYGKRNFVLDRQESDDITLRSVDIERYATTYKEHDGVYLFREEMVELVYHTPPLSSIGLQSWRTVALRYLVLNPDNDDLSTFDLKVEEEVDLRKIYITLVSPDGSISRFDVDDMNIVVDGRGYRRYRLAYPAIERGTIVDVGYETLEEPLKTNNFHHIFELQHSLPCERLTADYIYPKNWHANIIGEKKKDNRWREEHYIREDEERGFRTAHYEAWDVPPLYEEPYSPFKAERTRRMEVSIISATMENSIVTMAPASWTEFGNRIIRVMLDGYKPQSRKVQALVDGAVNRGTDEGARMTAILDWISTKIRNRSRGRSVRYGPFEALDRGEGQMQEITALAGLMMLNAGLDVNFLLVHSAFDRPVDNYFVALDLYYTPALSVTIGDSILYLFPWIRDYPMGHIPSFLQGEPALVMDARGYRKRVTLPRSSLARSVITSTYDAEISREGIVTVREERTLEGDAAFVLRRELEDLDKIELEDEIRELVIYEGGRIDFEGYEVKHRDAYDRPLIITLHYTIDGLVTVTPEEAVVRIEELFSPSFRYNTKVATSERKNPIRIYYDEEVTKEITLRVPEEWQVGPLPDNLREETGFGTATASYMYRPGVLTATYTRTLRRSEGSTEQSDELMRLIGRNSKLNLPTLVFTF